MLEKLESWNSERTQISLKYNKGLEGIGDLRLPFVLPGLESVWHQFIIRSNKRNELQDFLKENGIGTIIHYPIPPHLQECYKELGYGKGDFPIAEELADTVLSLPIYPGLKDSDIAFICEVIKNFFRK